jgi:phage FluMu protein Com
VQVTVRCSGPGLADAEVVATVSVPCPDCGCINQLSFEPDGTVRSVVPASRGYYPVPEPSAN